MMRFEKVTPVLLLSILLFACSAPVEEAVVEDTPADVPTEIQLFDGQTLDGWEAFLEDPDVPKEDVWSVVDGVLVCKGEPLGYLHTTQKFTSFKLIVEWRWAPGTEPGNSGVLMRINGDPKPIPRSIEAQLKSGDAGDLYGFHGMKIDGDPDRKREVADHELLGDLVGVSRIEPNENSPGEWNRYEITLNGTDLEVFVNGKKTNEAFDVDVVEGPIGLQSEGGEIHFRAVTLTPIG